MARDTAARLNDQINAAQKRAEATRLDDNDIAFKDRPGCSLMGVAGENHVEFRRLAGDFPGNR
jgi:hypothetical protein